MIGAVVLLIFLYALNQGIFASMVKRHAWFSKKLMNQLFGYHLLFFIIYYIYASFHPSDSVSYFYRAVDASLGWLDHFYTSSRFIFVLAYAVVSYFKFRYETMMLLFSWFGYLGFVYVYLFFRENIPIK